MLIDVLGNNINIGDYIAAVGFSGLDIGQVIEFQNADTLIMVTIKEDDIFGDRVKIKRPEEKKGRRYVRPENNAIKISDEMIMLYKLKK